MVLVAAFVGGYVARRLKVSPLVGYLLAGVAVGPFTPGFVGDIADISQIAELGVIFMMFGVGLHFSIKDLWAVRRIAIPGALGQMLVATAMGLGLTQLWGWTVGAGLALGLAISIASTVVLLRGLMDNGLLQTRHGQVAVGWLILEDLATVAILVILPAVLGDVADPWRSATGAIVKTIVFVAAMLFVGSRIMPWVLKLIARTRSRELFILAVVVLALGTALGAAVLFNVSLALGAFLAGVVIAESDVSYQVGAEVLPFREIFAVLFFVSVGMLVNPLDVVANAGQVLAITGLIVIGKFLITVLMGAALRAPARTSLVVSAGLSQIGEFSFIVGQASMSLGVLSQEQYGLILAGALLSIVVNPWMFHLIPVIEARLQRWPRIWHYMNGVESMPPLSTNKQSQHVVIVGHGRVGKHIVDVLDKLKVPMLVVELDATHAETFKQRGIPTLFGDAANSEVLSHVGLARARALAITISNETSAEVIVGAAHELAPTVPIIARAATTEGVRRLAERGATDVIHPELEGGLEIMRHTLIALDYPTGQVHQYIDAERRNAYHTSNGNEDHRRLDHFMAAVRGMEIVWRPIRGGSALIGRSLAEANLRAKHGISVIALVRNREVVANPAPHMRFAEDDVIGLLGEADQIAAAEL